MVPDPQAHVERGDGGRERETSLPATRRAAALTHTGTALDRRAGAQKRPALPRNMGRAVRRVSQLPGQRAPRRPGAEHGATGATDCSRSPGTSLTSPARKTRVRPPPRYLAGALPVAALTLNEALVAPVAPGAVALDR